MNPAPDPAHPPADAAGPVLYTIGCSGTSAGHFFGRLRAAGVRRVVDTRLRNTSQLAGFARRDDLAFFCGELLGAEYVHEPRWAPTASLLDARRAGALDWEEYARRFRALLAERAVAAKGGAAALDRTCLLCSEPSAEHCHRRLVAEHLAASVPAVRVVHL